jgi:hypothetical protein
MAKNTGEERRIFLFKNFGKYIKVNYKNKPTSLVDLNLGEEAPKGAGWNKFIEMYFSDENGVLDFFKDIKKLYGLFSGQNQTTLQSLVPKVNLQQNDPTNLFIFYACDMPWAQNIGYCTGKPNIDDKVGDYTTDNTLIKKIKISKGPDNIDSTKESLYINSPYFEKLPKLGNYNLSDYAVSKLTQSATDSPIFTLSNQSGESLPNATITFDNTGFTFQFLTFKIIATKIKSEPVDTTKKDNTVVKKDDTVVKKDDTVVKKDKDDEIPVVRTKPLYFDTDKEDDTPTKDCGDFPFTLGCVNTKIGDLSAKLFRGDRKKDVYTQKLQDFLYHTGNFGSENPNKELSKDLWNDLMNRQVIKESVKKVLKEYINKKK